MNARRVKGNKTKPSVAPGSGRSGFSRLRHRSAFNATKSMRNPCRLGTAGAVHLGVRVPRTPVFTSDWRPQNPVTARLALATDNPADLGWLLFAKLQQWKRSGRVPQPKHHTGTPGQPRHQRTGSRSASRSAHEPTRKRFSRFGLKPKGATRGLDIANGATPGRRKVTCVVTSLYPM